MISSLKKKSIYLSIVLIIVVITVITLSSKKDSISYEKEVIVLSSIKQIVNETGIVKPSRDANLSFKQSGQITSIPISEGSIVSTGSILVYLDSKDAKNAVRNAETSLKSAELELAKFLINSKKDVQNAYRDLLNTSTTPVPENLYSNETPPTIQGTYIKDKEVRILIETYQAGGAGEYFGASSVPANIVSGGGLVSTTTFIPIGDSGLSIKFAALNQSVNWIINLPNKLATTYNADYLAYQDALIAEKEIVDSDNLNELDLQTKQLAVKQAEDALQDAKDNLSDYYIRAPFSGIITNVSASTGEFISIGVPVISIISKNKHEISVNIPEDDIALVDIGDEASITFDAYDDLILYAKVISISPNTEKKEGVNVFKVALQFTEDSKQIKPGLSVDVDIITEKLENIIAVPSRSVIEKNGERFVRLLVGENTYKKQMVSLGLRGENGLVEIKTGLNINDTVITFISDKEVEMLIEIE